MAIALVKAGAIAEVSTTSVTPAFGQATTAGNCLMAVVAHDAGGTTSTAATGWSPSFSRGSDFVATVDVFFKQNCGASETAPTFTALNATQMTAMLMEWSGLDQVSPADQFSAANLDIVNTAPDTTASDVAVFARYDVCSKSCTATYAPAWTPAGGTIVTIANDGATKQVTHFFVNAYLLNGNGGAAADSYTGTGPTLSTGIISNSGYCVSSFKPTIPYYPYDRFDSRRRGKSPIHRAAW